MGIWTKRAPSDTNGNDRQARTDANDVDDGLDGRIDPGKLVGKLVHGSIGNLLADDVPTRTHAEEHMPTLPVEHGAQRLARIAALSRRRLELQRRRLALGSECAKLVDGHTRNTFMTSSPKWLIAFTAIRPVLGLGNGRETALRSESQASSSISALRVVLSAL